MTVKELIKALQQYPGDMEVVSALDTEVGGDPVVVDIAAVQMKEVMHDDVFTLDVIVTGDDIVDGTTTKVVLLVA